MEEYHTAKFNVSLTISLDILCERTGGRKRKKKRKEKKG